MIEYILNPQSVEALGWTLLHSLWQGAIFALLLVLILIALRSYSAQSRYLVSVGLLCAFFLTVSVTFWQQWQGANSRVELASQQLNQPLADDIFILNNSKEKVLDKDQLSQSTLPPNSEVLANGQSSWIGFFTDYYERHLPLLVTFWLLGILVLQLRFLGQLAYVQRLKHYGTRLFPKDWGAKIKELEDKLRIQKKVAYLTSFQVESPMVIGWLRPVILVPHQIFNSLSETEIYAVLAHELAHIRREDFVVNLMQTFLCNIFFFHPGVWWMSNRIDDEREHCCDDLAVAATGQATSYAKTLINVSELQLRMQENPVLAMALSGKKKKRERGGFTARIHRLFKVGSGAGSFREGFVTACILITALSVGVVATGSNVQNADAQTLSENDQTEVTPLAESKDSKDDKKDNKAKTSTTTTTTTWSDDKPISSTSQTPNLNTLPIAEPQEPVEPADPEQAEVPVGSSETRIDALVNACKEGDFEFVKTLVKSGININRIGSKGYTPLIVAAMNDEEKIIAYLLKKGANVNQTINGWTALHEAADEGALASMRLLLRAGANVNYYQTDYSPTAISMAASEGHIDCLELLLKNGADINGIGKSLPPLHIAAAESQEDVIEYLISKGVNIDKKDPAGRTALMYAASEGQKYAVIKLLEGGADKRLVDYNGASAKDYAEEEEEFDTRDYLGHQNSDSGNKHTGCGDPNSDTRGKYSEERGRYSEERGRYSEERGRYSEERGRYSEERGKYSDKRGNQPAIHQATERGLIEIVQQMVKSGTSVNTRDDYGRTPLHIAAAENHNTDMDVLIDLGADLNAQDQEGRTPLMYAAAAANKNAVELLAYKGAKIEIRDDNGMRAFDWAHTGGSPSLANFLDSVSENNQQKSIRKVKGRSAKKETFHINENSTHLRQYNIEDKIPELIHAIRHESVDYCRKLLNNGASANSADDTGQTLLMVAVRQNRLDMAKLLIEKGADVNKSSASGLTALHYAALENHDDMARLLLNNRANVDPTMRYSSTDGNYSNEPLVWEYIGATPLLIAVESGNIEVLSVLINAGANKNQRLVRNEYRLNKNRVSYLTRSEVVGIDDDFLNNVKVRISDDAWTPYKQALHLNDPSILAYFPL